MDRSAASKALAKAIAYEQCGKVKDAQEWLATLVAMFESEGIVLAE